MTIEMRDYILNNEKTNIVISLDSIQNKRISIYVSLKPNDWYTIIVLALNQNTNRYEIENSQIEVDVFNALIETNIVIVENDILCLANSYLIKLL